jgi:hypothetical protein
LALLARPKLRAGLARILNHLKRFCLTGAMRFGPPRHPRHVMMRRPKGGLLLVSR